MSKPKQTPLVELYKSTNGKITVATYNLELTDSKSGELKQIEMVRITKTQNKLVEGMGYQDIKSYFDLSALAFRDMNTVIFEKA